MNLDINQEQNQVIDGETVANNPDFGAWYNDADENLNMPLK
ncbi:MAG: hypothetical protein ACLSB9_00585 [Hydrogeniiclostridium mannosilyticum]